MVIPLHLPSHWSIGHGVASLEELSARGAEWGLPYMALTDLENLCGAVEFHHRCRTRGIRPILGVELRRGFVSHGKKSRVGRRPAASCFWPASHRGTVPSAGSSRAAGPTGSLAPPAIRSPTSSPIPTVFSP